MLQLKRFWPIALLILIGVVSLLFPLLVAKPYGACAVEDATDLQLKTVSTLNDIVDLGLKISTTLVGFGAAAVIGLKGEVKLGRFMRVMVVISVMLFAQSALYGVWWRFGVAQMYLIECLSMITAPALQWRFQGHVYFFMLGIGAVGVLVLGALFREPEREDFET